MISNQWAALLTAATTIMIIIAATRHKMLPIEDQYCSLETDKYQFQFCSENFKKGQSIQQKAGSTHYANFNQLDICHYANSTINMFCLNAVVNGASAEQAGHAMHLSMKSQSVWLSFAMLALGVLLNGYVIPSIKNSSLFSACCPKLATNRDDYESLLGTNPAGQAF